MTSRVGPPDAALEASARILEQSGDYRVLRRLVPRDDFGVVSGGALQRGIVLDTETTGTDTESDRVVELGLVAFDFEPSTGAIVRISGVYDSLEDPGVPIPAEVTAIHGITDEMVAGARIDDSAVAAFVAGAQWVVAHNAAFDRPVIERRLPLFESLPWVCSYAEIPWRQEGIGGSKLEYLANSQGFFYDGHRSETDCRALLEVLRKPLPKSGAIAWQRLLESGARSSYRIWAVDAPFEAKDLLRARGYRWDARRRCWHRTMGREEATAEAPWLKQRVYGGRSREVEVEIQDALTRYSARPGRIVKRSL
jgi:DNA polymerase III subunit epsilon